eukprot:9395303-Lingulodinium_polyedra.AAC.1
MPWPPGEASVATTRLAHGCASRTLANGRVSAKRYVDLLDQPARVGRCARTGSARRLDLRANVLENGARA